MILFLTANYAQQDTLARKQVNKILATHYFDKGKYQTKAAIILAGSGLVLGTVAVAIFPRDYDIFGDNTSKTENVAGISTVMFITGAALLITSIPYFISGGVNKHRAKLMMRTENLSLAPRVSLPIRQFKTGIVITI
jgi:hypothetical protein